MTERYATGIYYPQNKSKYKGSRLPFYRSGWELVMFQFLDRHPDVKFWVSEPFTIKYKDPVTGMVRSYYPDLLVEYRDRNGKTRKVVVEIKPSTQAVLTEARTKRDKAELARNLAKWKAAKEFCNRLGLEFIVITEKNLFPFGQG